MKEEENVKLVKEIIAIFEKEGLLKDIILIGSWCLLFYERLLTNYRATMKTTDIDFYVPNPKTVKEKNNIVNSLKEKKMVCLQDSMTGKTTFISEDSFELEFVTRLNRDQLSCVRVGDTGIYAESIPYVDIFSTHYVLIDIDGILLKVASPACYILQKLIINDKRGVKKQKDIDSIKMLLPCIWENEKYDKELEEVYVSLPPKWKRKVDEASSSNNISLFKNKKAYII